MLTNFVQISRPALTAFVALAMMALPAHLAHAKRIKMLSASRELTEEMRLKHVGVLKAKIIPAAIATSSGGPKQDDGGGFFPDSNASYLSQHAWGFDIDEEFGGGAAHYRGAASVFNNDNVERSLLLSMRYEFVFEIDMQAVIRFQPRLLDGSIARVSLGDGAGNLLQERMLDLSSPASEAALQIFGAGTYMMWIELGPQTSGNLPLGDSSFVGAPLDIGWTMDVPAPGAFGLLASGMLVVGTRRERLGRGVLRGAGEE